MIRDVLISFGFWACVLLATLTFAAAMLSVKLAEHDQLQARFLAGEADLHQLAEQVGRYERYCEQLDNSSARGEQSQPLSHSLAVEAALKFQLDRSESATVLSKPTSRLSQAVQWISQSQLTRIGLVGLSGLLLIVGFGYLVESPSSADPHHRGDTRAASSRWQRRLRSIHRRWQQQTTPDTIQ